MSQLMAVLLNGIAQLEYDRNKPLPAHQGAYLDKMDRKMDAGIDIGGALVKDPDVGQRAQFVAANLLHAIKTNDEASAAALCTYLAVRQEELKQVKITEDDGMVSIELEFDQDYVKQYPVTFDKLQ
jgi:hypothetical protein